MLYTVSYFEPQHHHGLKIAVSRTIPRGFKVDGSLLFLAPSSDLLNDWKAQKIDESGYIQRYREQIKDNWIEVKLWLDSLNSKQRLTILCYEKAGSFCHRTLIIKLVKKYRPDCFGGCDVLRFELPLCQNCSTELIPGLDSNFCPVCRVYSRS